MRYLAMSAVFVCCFVSVACGGSPGEIGPDGVEQGVRAPGVSTQPSLSPTRGIQPRTDHAEHAAASHGAIVIEAPISPACYLANTAGDHGLCGLKSTNGVEYAYQAYFCHEPSGGALTPNAGPYGNGHHGELLPLASGTCLHAIDEDTLEIWCCAP